MTDLKLCPFCGSSANAFSPHNSNFHHVECDECQARSEQCYTVEIAIEAWNKRYINETQVSKIAKDRLRLLYFVHEVSKGCGASTADMFASDANEILFEVDS